jgi:hypothetical protein
LVDVSKCRANSYNRKVRHFNTLSKSQYEAAKCDDNDYYDPVKTKIKQPSLDAERYCCTIDSFLSPEEMKARREWCKKQGVKLSCHRRKDDDDLTII